MQSNILKRTLRTGAAVGFLLALGVGVASAQCTISGPSTLCGGSADLCGPPGPYYYEWSDANGNPIGDQQCLTVTAPGTYVLMSFDFINGLWAGPCSLTVAAGGASSCSVSGPASVCEGATAELCGPEGAPEYQWSGPAGFSSGSRCVSVGAAGLYELRVRSVAGGCWSSPCQWNVAVERCNRPGNCPMTRSLWLRQCRPGRAREARVFDREQMAAIAACVDSRSALLNWKDASEGLCRTLGDRSGLRDRARGQFAAVLANVCASRLGLSKDARGVDAATVLSLDGFSGTVDAWLAGAEARLSELDRRFCRDRHAKSDWCRVIRQGWQINHGQGMGPVCAPSPSLEIADEMGAQADPALNEESLAEELRDPEESIMFESMQPNPAAGPVQIAYVVSSSARGEMFLGVYDLAGRLVRVLRRGVEAPGRHVVVWDGRGEDGGAMGNGAYFVRGRIGAQSVDGRLILLR